MQLSLFETDYYSRHIHRPALRYFGGKWRLAPWIIKHFPFHTTYVEPYGGSFSVGLRKWAGLADVYNDINADTVNFFSQLKQQPDALIAAIAQSGRSQIDFEESRQPCDDPLEQARRYYLSCQMSFCGGGTRWSSGTTKQRLALPSIHDDSHLWPIARRLQSVQIFQVDAFDCIRYYDSPDTLFYIDPPYLHTVRGSKDKRHKSGAPRRQYKHEIEQDQHIQLAQLLHQIQGAAIVSGYSSGLYHDFFSDWDHCSKPVGDQLECLWIKPAVAAEGQNLKVLPYKLSSR